MFSYIDNEQIKKEIKKAITDQGLTAKEICKKIGMLPQTYQCLINKKNFSFSDMKRICDAMDCDLIIDIRKRNWVSVLLVFYAQNLMSVCSVQILLVVRGGKTVCLSEQDQSYINIYLLTVYFLFSISVIFMLECLKSYV